MGVRCFTHVTSESYQCKAWNVHLSGISQADGQIKWFQQKHISKPMCVHVTVVSPWRSSSLHSFIFKLLICHLYLSVISKAALPVRGQLATTERRCQRRGHVLREHTQGFWFISPLTVIQKGTFCCCTVSLSFLLVLLFSASSFLLVSDYPNLPRGRDTQDTSISWVFFWA